MALVQHRLSNLHMVIGVCVREVPLPLTHAQVATGGTQGAEGAEAI